MRKTVLVTGATGQLGSLVLRHAPQPWDVVAPQPDELDLNRPDSIARYVRDVGPDVIINCAAYTDVDGAQTDPQTCWTVNAEAPGHLARAAAVTGARLLHMSTDYVFDGDATSPYPEDTAVSGLGEYGRSKAAGELAVREAGEATIVRTAWLYAPGQRNFVATMLRLAAGGQPLRVVDDQVGQPTYADDVAVRLVSMIESDTPPGTYHATNSGQTSWCGFAREILRRWGFDNEVVPVTSQEFVRPAPRPAYSVLGHDRWQAVGMPPLRDWTEALNDAHAYHRATFLGGLA